MTNVTDAAEAMQLAIEAAKTASHHGDAPIGAVLVESGSGQVIAIAGNRVEQDGDPTAHAEMLAIREGAARLGAKRLPECDLYVTLEPCTMCAQAVAHARIRRLYFGAYDPKGGGVDHGARVFSQPTCHHRPEVVGGLMEQICGRMLKAFFQARR